MTDQEIIESMRENIKAVKAPGPSPKYLIADPDAWEISKPRWSSIFKRIGKALFNLAMYPLRRVFRCSPIGTPKE